jgi:hypothetical protein
MMIIAFDELLKKLQTQAIPGDTKPSDALWVKFGERKTQKTVEYRSSAEEIVHIYLDENDDLVGIEIFP